MRLTKKNNIFSHIFRHPRSSHFAQWMLFTLIIQQIIAASSSFWITGFAHKIQLGQDWKQNLTLFLISMVLPYLPGAFALHLLNSWIFSTQKISAELYVDRLKGRIDIVNDEGKRAIHSTQMSKELPQFITDSLTFFFQYSAQSLNLFFQLLVVSFILGISYLLPLIIGILFIFLYLKLSKVTNENLAKKNQQSASQISAQLSSGWGTITIDNRINFNFWNSKLENLFDLARLRNRAYSWHKEFGGAILSLIGAIPFLLYIVYRFLWNTPNLSDLVTLSVLLPRIFQLFNVGTSVCIQTKYIGSLKGRWKELENNINELEKNTNPLENRINPNKIHINKYSTDESYTINEFKFILQNLNKGLFTISGPNGSGKSSLLLKLKKQLAEKAIYIPPNADIHFKNLENKHFSTGQRIRQIIKEVITLETQFQPKFLLLDEWDANLDYNVRKEITEDLRQESLKYVIIEIRHSI